MSGGVTGLRKHAGGGSSNTHATGGIDALTPSDIGAGQQPTLRIVETVATDQTLTAAEAEIVAVNLDTGFNAFMPLHIYANIGSGNATDTMRARIRFHFSDGTTKDAAESLDAGLSSLILHYDNGANTSVADAWSTAETAVNLHTVLGTGQNNKKLNKISLRARRTAPIDPANPATFDWTVRVAAMQS